MLIGVYYIVLAAICLKNSFAYIGKYLIRVSFLNHYSFTKNVVSLKEKVCEINNSIVSIGKTFPLDVSTPKQAP